MLQDALWDPSLAAGGDNDGRFNYRNFAEEGTLRSALSIYSLETETPGREMTALSTELQIITCVKPTVYPPSFPCLPEVLLGRAGHCFFFYILRD